MKCKEMITPPGTYGSFQQYECGRPANDAEFEGLCKMHGNAKRRMRTNDAKRQEMRQTSEDLEAVGKGAIEALAGYGLPNPEEARPAYSWPAGRFSPGRYTGGVELTKVQAAWLVEAFVNGAE